MDSVGSQRLLPGLVYLLRALTDKWRGALVFPLSGYSLNFSIHISLYSRGVYLAWWTIICHV